MGIGGEAGAKAEGDPAEILEVWQGKELWTRGLVSVARVGVSGYFLVSVARVELSGDEVRGGSRRTARDTDVTERQASIFTTDGNISIMQCQSDFTILVIRMVWGFG